VKLRDYGEADALLARGAPLKARLALYDEIHAHNVREIDRYYKPRIALGIAGLVACLAVLIWMVATVRAECVLTLLNGTTVHGQGCTFITTGPTPAPTFVPGPTPRPTTTPVPGQCFGTSLDVPIGRDNFGLFNQKVATNQAVPFRANIPAGKSSVRFEIATRCVGARALLTVRSPSGVSCGDQPRACRFVQPSGGCYQVSLFGLPPGPECENGVSKFDITYRYE
jgi:hypothetical protein